MNIFPIPINSLKEAQNGILVLNPSLSRQVLKAFFTVVRKVIFECILFCIDGLGMMLT